MSKVFYVFDHRGRARHIIKSATAVQIYRGARPSISRTFHNVNNAREFRFEDFDDLSAIGLGSASECIRVLSVNGTFGAWTRTAGRTVIFGQSPNPYLLTTVSGG